MIHRYHDHHQLELGEICMWPSKKIPYALGGFAGGILITAFFTRPPLSSSDWAAWVQAVGSIAAIFGAFLVGRYQVEAARRHDQEKSDADELNRRAAIAEMVQFAAEQVNLVSTSIKTVPAHIFRTQQRLPLYPFLEVINYLSVIPLHEVGSKQAVRGIAGMVLALKKIKNSIDVFLSAKDDAVSFALLKGQILTASDVAITCATMALEVLDTSNGKADC